MLLPIFAILLITSVKGFSAPVLTEICGVGGTILLIPIVLIEGVVAYFLIKRFFGFRISIWRALLIFLVANIFSSILGFLSGFFIRFYASSILDFLGGLFIGYFITAVVETPVIHLFIRNKTSKSLIDSGKISVIVNIFSYLLIFLVFVFWFHMYIYPTTLDMATGFSKLKPLTPSIRYTTTGEFTASFTNTIGTNITITNATLTDKTGDSIAWRLVLGVDDSTTWSDPTINDVDPTTSPQTLRAGDSVKLNAIEANRVRNAGDPFDLEITITYTAVMGGISREHRDTGRITSVVEAG